MQYLLMIHSDEKAMQSASKDDIGTMLAAYGAYTKAMKDAGAWVGGERLHPASTATTVRVQNGSQRAVRRGQGTARRLLSHRGPRSRRGHWLGRALPRRLARRGRGAADLGDVTDSG
jgi:hypothetical protein